MTLATVRLYTFRLSVIIATIVLWIAFVASIANAAGFRVTNHCGGTNLGVGITHANGAYGTMGCGRTSYDSLILHAIHKTKVTTAQATIILAAGSVIYMNDRNKYADAKTTI